MTVVALDDDRLWVHSPVEPTEDVLEDVARLGTVAFIVAPNKIHSRGLRPWSQEFPNAEAWVSPRFPERHPDVPVDGVLGSHKPPGWGAEIAWLVFEGSSYLDEVVFFHATSGTLIVTDLIQRHDPHVEPLLWRLIKRAAGVLAPSGGTSHDLRATFRNRAAARRSAQAVLDWQFDRVVISHGLCIRTGSHRFVSNALKWASRP